VLYEFGPVDETGRARLRSITDGGNTITVSYVTTGYGQNEISRIREETTGREVRFTYDTLSRVKTVTSLDNVVTTFDYNPSGDMITAQSNWGMLTFGYDADHNITSVTDGMGGHVSYISYGGSARGTEFRNASGESTDYSYTLDGNGNVASATFGLRGQSPTVYTFNAQRLLSSVTAPGSSKVCYTYTADKCLTGQTYSSVQQAIKVAEATSSQVRAGS
jgi:YD repeat-containing protein